ncbi:hypothetical protein EDD18DRAFT_1279551 [Armillaria luteobubalina]|uniref:C3H1-type domain-containing protein n=1 Tax=Armillaria luteobubalina TaxID=153913 RepID=A0AA39QGD5_9AGAR|nr:hypothetical protein EDD18DRAFT_1279551 [Armillaria luteobubalina]
MSSSVLRSGNGIACRFYNHDGCNKGDACAYSHAADSDSIQDSCGKNVCLHFLKGYCRFGDYKCRYSHSRDHLAQKDIDAISATLASSSKAAHEATKVSPDAPKTKTKKKAKKTLRSKAPAPAANRYAHNFEGDFDWDIEDEMEERTYNYGFTEDDVQELLCQGVKPWDDDAMDVLAALHDYY